MSYALIKGTFQPLAPDLVHFGLKTRDQSGVYSNQWFQAERVTVADKFAFYSLSPKASGTKAVSGVVTQDNTEYACHLIARVLFAETLGVTPEERFHVAEVIFNRIGHRGFKKGTLKTALAVVKSPGAFTCINDDHNNQWKRAAHPDRLKDRDSEVYAHCLELATALVEGKFVPKDAQIVYYHDDSIEKDFSNIYWKTRRLITTDQLRFYGITEVIASR